MRIRDAQMQRYRQEKPITKICFHFDPQEKISRHNYCIYNYMEFMCPYIITACIYEDDVTVKY